MKNLTLNKGIQLMWLVLLVAVVLASLVINPGFLFYGLFLALLIGISQFVVSAINVIRLNGKSEFNVHFAISLSYILVLIGFGISGIDIETNKLIYFPLVTIPAGLAIYFWYLTFKKSEEITIQNHNVFDL